MAHRITIEKTGLILSKLRNKHHISQAELAKRLNVSKQTVVNWENGNTSPSIADAWELFEILGENPIPHIKELSYERASSSVKQSEKDMAHYNIECMTDKEIEIFNYLMSGLHGSSPYAVLQEIAANLSCPIGDRHTVAMIVHNYYQIESQAGHVQKYVVPDLSALTEAMESALNAYVTGKNGYHKV